MTNSILALLAILVFVIPPATLSQQAERQSTPVHNPSNLYIRAIAIYLDTTYNRYGKIDTSINWSARLFEADQGIVDEIPNRISSFGIKWLHLDTTLLWSIAREKRTVPITRIWPLYNSRDTLMMSFSEYRFSINGSEYNYAQEGACIIRFTYDCNRKEFVVYDVKIWGV
jgi:hypothetical protein